MDGPRSINYYATFGNIIITIFFISDLEKSIIPFDPKFSTRVRIYEFNTHNLNKYIGP